MKKMPTWFLRGIAQGTGIALAPKLLLMIPSVRKWAIQQDGGLSSTGRISVCIFLILLCAGLVVLLIRSHLAYSRFRMRVYEKKVTDDELFPEMNKKVLVELKAANKKFPRPPWRR
jgi:hypothetical protein